MKTFTILFVFLGCLFSSFSIHAIHLQAKLECDAQDLHHNHNKLIVGVNGSGNRNVWSSTMRQQLSYCISNDFGSLKSKMVSAFEASVRDWQRYADVRFIYMRSQDSKCNDSNRDVLFRVNMFNNPSSNLAGRAFFPNAAASGRKIIFNKKFVQGSSSLLLWLTKHELGHVLGFRHEFANPQNSSCSEGGRFDELTGYDRSSIMHYEQCGGAKRSTSLSKLDRQGAKLAYP